MKQKKNKIEETGIKVQFGLVISLQELIKKLKTIKTENILLDYTSDSFCVIRTHDLIEETDEQEKEREAKDAEQIAKLADLTVKQEKALMKKLIEKYKDEK